MPWLKLSMTMMLNVAVPIADGMRAGKEESFDKLEELIAQQTGAKSVEIDDCDDERDDR